MLRGVFLNALNDNHYRIGLSTEIFIIYKMIYLFPKMAWERLF